MAISPCAESRLIASRIGVRETPSQSASQRSLID
jgi:hypothetical protein